MTSRINKGNRSVLYLALLSLLYYSASTLYTTYNATHYSTPPDASYTYIEIVDKDKPIVHRLTSNDTSQLQSIYNVPYELKNGDRITISDGQSIARGQLSGIKRISLRVPIGVNSASHKDLTALPGIGPVIAGRIVQYRESRGEFRNLDELMNVKGVGEGKYVAIKEYINLD